MPQQTISTDLKQLLTKHEDLIKADYITIKMFVDSAVRDKLRSMKVPQVGDDEIVAHLAKLRKSRARHLNQQSVLQAKRRHQRRMAKIKQELNETQ